MTTKPKSITYHPACLLFQELRGDELQELADDIKVHGLRNAVILHEGKVLDGRNRLAACKLAGVEPRFEEWTGTGSPVEWVISENLIRRHLTASQRAVVAHDLLPLLEREAKDRQRQSNNYRANGRLAPECANRNGKGKASEAAARIARSSARYVETVKAISAQAPELLDLIRNGDINVPDAAKLSKLPPAQRRTAVTRVKDGDPRPFFRGCNQPVTKQNDVRTPDGLCQFLYDLISEHCPAKVILDPCAGDGALTRPWKKSKVHWFEIKRGKDFFRRRNPFPDVELVLANVPFSGNPDGKELFPAKFLSHIFEIVPTTTPVAFFAPFHFLLNSRIESNDYAGRENRYAWLRDSCPPITSIIPLPQDVYCVNGVKALVHSQILLFNMPRLDPVVFVPQKYLGW